MKDAADRRKLVSKWHPTTKGTLRRNYRVPSKSEGRRVLKAIASLLSDDDHFVDATSHKVKEQFWLTCFLFLPVWSILFFLLSQTLNSNSQKAMWSHLLNFWRSQGCQIRRETAHGESVCCNNVRALFDELPTPHLVVEITPFPAGSLTEKDYTKAEKLETVLRSGPSVWVVLDFSCFNLVCIHFNCVHSKISNEVWFLSLFLAF